LMRGGGVLGEDGVPRGEGSSHPREGKGKKRVEVKREKEIAKKRRVFLLPKDRAKRRMFDLYEELKKGAKIQEVLRQISKEWSSQES